MATVTDRLVLTEKVIYNCRDYEEWNKYSVGTNPLNRTNDKVLATCSKGTVMFSDNNKKTIWAIYTMENDLYRRVKSYYGKYLEQGGIERLHYDDEKTDVVFAFAGISPIITIPNWEDGLIAWCMEACNSGVNAFKDILLLDPATEEKYVKSILGARNLRLKNLLSTLGLDEVVTWEGGPKSWHSMRYEISKVKSIIHSRW
jgi:hypothetical protein